MKVREFNHKLLEGANLKVAICKDETLKCPTGCYYEVGSALQIANYDEKGKEIFRKLIGDYDAAIMIPDIDILDIDNMNIQFRQLILHELGHILKKHKHVRAYRNDKQSILNYLQQEIEADSYVDNPQVFANTLKCTRNKHSFHMVSPEIDNWLLDMRIKALEDLAIKQE